MYRDYDYSHMFTPGEILVYLRKSRSDDPTLTVEEVLAKHETILDEWTQRYLDAAIPSENKFREVVSGETIADRPEIKKLLKLIESPRYKAILTVEVQRLSRGDLEDAGRLIKILRYTNTFVITPQKTYDLNDEYDRDMFERELKRGNEFLEYQKKIMNRGRLLSVSQGNYLASIPPYGYEKTWVMDGKRKCPTLKIKEDEAAVVRLMYDLIINKDMGIHRIAHHFDSLGIKPPKGDHWSPHTIKDMIPNVHYIGKVRWNFRKTVTIVENGEIKKTQPKSKLEDQLIYEGKHPAIVSEDIFYAAVEKIGRCQRTKPNTKIRNPLAGLVYCQCGRAMSLRMYKKADGSQRSPSRLLCDGQVYCHTGSILYDDMIERVCSILEEHIDSFEFQMKNQDTDALNIQRDIIISLEKRLKDLEAKELAQWEAQADPDPAKRMPQEIFIQLNAKLTTEKEELKQAIKKAHAELPKPINYEEKIIKFKDALNTLRDSNADAQTKNTLLKSCIERIIYKKDAPERLKRKPGEKKGTLPIYGGWTQPPIELEVKLRV